MSKKIDQPLEGKPFARLSIDANGDPRFRIFIHALTPLRAKAADVMVGLMLVFVLYVAVLWVIDRWGAPLAGTLSRLSFIGIVFVALAMLVNFLLRRVTVIEMRPETISVYSWFGRQSYDRNIEHAFALLIHDEAHSEQLRNDLATRKASAIGRVIQKKEYYAQSLHVVLAYAGQRRDLLSVYGAQDAAAIVARLQYCDRCLNEAMRMGGGIHHRPEDEWNDVPGGLPEG